MTGYRPLGGDWNLQWRVEAGEVFATFDVTGIPDTLLFRAGGQDSVRGYGYRTLGPVVERRRHQRTHALHVQPRTRAPDLEPDFRRCGARVFVDAGNASNSWSEMRPVVGVGPGIRWRSPVGALRVDLAYAIDDRRWRLEVSLGIAP